MTAISTRLPAVEVEYESRGNHLPPKRRTGSRKSPSLLALLRARSTPFPHPPFSRLSPVSQHSTFTPQLAKTPHGIFATLGEISFSGTEFGFPPRQSQILGRLEQSR